MQPEQPTHAARGPRDLDTVATAMRDLLATCAGPGVRLVNIRPGGGNAGFSYLCDLEGGQGPDRVFVRLAPPGVRRAGTADVFRQSAALRALDTTDVPHPVVLAEGEHAMVGDYLVTSVVEGRNRGEPGSLSGLGEKAHDRMAEAAMTALAGVHSVLPGPLLDYLGPFEGFHKQVTRWDRFFERGAYAREMAELYAATRSALLDAAPTSARLSLCHGDFQFGNLMFTDTGELTAVIDWELCAVAPSLSDLGWIMAFHDRVAWGEVPRESAGYFTPGQFRELYEVVGGDSVGVEWFQALAHFKYAVIASLNLGLHRRGKREDPEWEVRGPGALTNMRHAAHLVDAAR